MSKLTRIGHVQVPPGTGLTLRALIPLIPFVGGSASVLVEAKLAERQTQRIDQLYEHLMRRGSSEGGSPDAPFNDDTLELAVRAAAGSTEAGRSGMIASILHQADGDPSEQIRRILVDICGVLTNYELAVMLSLSGDATNGIVAAALERLVEVDVAAPEFADIRSFAMHRLLTFRLISASDASAKVTSLGRRLLAAARDEFGDG